MCLSNSIDSEVSLPWLKAVMLTAHKKTKLFIDKNHKDSFAIKPYHYLGKKKKCGAMFWFNSGHF